MNMKLLHICSLMYLIHGVIGSSIRMNATPTDVKDGLTSTLTLRCALNDTVPASNAIIGRRDITQTSENVEEVTSLVIMKEGKDVASVSHAHPAHVISGSSSNVQVAGGVTGASGERGFIELTISNPTRAQTGEYVCESNALSQAGHNIVFSTSLEVSMSEPTMADMVTYIRALRQEIDDLKNVVIFSAGSSKDLHVLKGQVVVYDIVNSNVGGGYNNVTGEFVCPVAGYYQFEISALGMPNQRFWLNLQHNNQDVISIHGANDDFHGTTNSAAIHLAKGDIVRVVPWADSYLHSRAMDQVFTTFNGHLLAVA